MHSTYLITALYTFLRAQWTFGTLCRTWNITSLLSSFLCFCVFFRFSTQTTSVITYAIFTNWLDKKTGPKVRIIDLSTHVAGMMIVYGKNKNTLVCISLYDAYYNNLHHDLNYLLSMAKSRQYAVSHFIKFNISDIIQNTLNQI